MRVHQKTNPGIPVKERVSVAAGGTGRLIPLSCCLSILLFTLLFGCTGEAPEIRQVFWQLNLAYDPGIGREYETLSAFVHVADADGIEDLDLIYILQDENELLWELDSDGWSKLENGEEVWIGSNNIRMNEGATFPRGLYRLIVIDRAGERTSDEFYVNTDELNVNTSAFPKATVTDESIKLEGDFNEFTLWFYDDSSNQVKIFTTNEKNLPISSALNTREQQIVRYFYVNTQNTKGGYGFIYGPVTLE